MTDYLVFIHGVNTREVKEQPHYADHLFDLIQAKTGNDLSLKLVELYWGDVYLAQEAHLLAMYQRSPLWSQLGFKDFREKQLLQFTGDAVLYISRSAGVHVVEKLRNRLSDGLKDYNPEKDRLHLITHSMGTVILFDILFSDRWDKDKANGYEGAEELRDLLFGLGPNKERGIRLYSITTMGSPISVYTLMMLSHQNLPNMHDITADLKEFLKTLHDQLKVLLPWQNFIHPDDPIAYPLAELLPEMIDQQRQYVQVKDHLTSEPAVPEMLWNILGKPGQLAELMFMSGPAHRSYWESEFVASEIAHTIKAAARQVSPALAGVP